MQLGSWEKGAVNRGNDVFKPLLKVRNSGLHGLNGVQKAVNGLKIFRLEKRANLDMLGFGGQVMLKSQQVYTWWWGMILARCTSFALANSVEGGFRPYQNMLVSDILSPCSTSNKVSQGCSKCEH